MTFDAVACAGAAGGEAGAPADIIKNRVELSLRGPLSRPLRMAKWYKWRGGAMKWPAALTLNRRAPRRLRHHKGYAALASKPHVKYVD